MILETGNSKLDGPRSCQNVIQFQVSSFSQQQRPLLHYYQTAKLLQKRKFLKIKPGS